MTQCEFQSWIEFYKTNPFDDLHRYYRPAALVYAAMGGKAEAGIEYLQPEIYSGEFDQADINVLKAFGIKKG
jgi:hypothetical protein